MGISGCLGGSGETLNGLKQAAAAAGGGAGCPEGQLGASYRGAGFQYLE